MALSDARRQRYFVGTPCSPLLDRLTVSAGGNKTKLNAESALSNSGAVPSYHVVHDILHVISTRCAAYDLHTTELWPLERTRERTESTPGLRVHRTESTPGLRVPRTDSTPG